MRPEDQASLTPADVLAALQAGNARFAAGESTDRDHLGDLPAGVGGQYPMAAVLSCIDSRVPVETVFDCGIGDLFVARVAGNVANADLVGSLEYACRVAGSKLIVVLGHQSCGAVSAAIDGVELGNITTLLAKITPAVDSTTTDGERASSNTAFVDDVIAANVAHTIAAIRGTSPILAEMEAAGEIAIVGAVYSLETGVVAFS